jgi:hypothetical protein
MVDRARVLLSREGWKALAGRGSGAVRADDGMALALRDAQIGIADDTHTQTIVALQP